MTIIKAELYKRLLLAKQKQDKRQDLINAADIAFAYGRVEEADRILKELEDNNA